MVPTSYYQTILNGPMLRWDEPFWRVFYLEDSKFLLNYIVDKNGNGISISHEYNADDLDAIRNGPDPLYSTVPSPKRTRTTVAESFGRSITFTYNPQGKIATMTDPAGRVTTYSYEDSNLINVSASGSQGTYYQAVYQYDNNHQLTVVSDPRAPKGNTQNSYSYYPDGRVQMVRSRAGQQYTDFEYDDINYRTTIKNYSVAPGVRTSYDQYDAQGYFTSSTDAQGNINSYAWDENFNRTSVTNSKGTTSYNYDNKGNCTSITDALGKATAFEYILINFANHPLPPPAPGTSGSFISLYLSALSRTNDALGRQNIYGYDLKGNLVSVQIKNPQGNIVSQTSYTYNQFGLRTSMTDANGHTTNYGYDGYGNLATVTDPLGNSVQYIYDVLGRCTSKIDANGKVTTYIWNDADRLTKITYPDGTEVNYTYDTKGNRLTVTDANNKTTKYSYSDADDLYSVLDPVNNTTRYEYDPFGNRTAMIDANGHRTEYTYDSLDRLVQTKDAIVAQGFSLAYVYDAVSNRVSMTDGNARTTNYTYDSVNRLLSENVVAEFISAYTYDDIGNRKTMTDSRGTTSYEYDALNRLTKIIYPVVGVRFIEPEITYDGVGNRKTMTYSGKTIEYFYDAANRLTEIRHPLFGTVKYEYDKIGNRTKMIYPNGVYTTYTYDPNNYRLLSIKHFNKRGTLIGHYDYTYDNVGNRLTMTDNIGTFQYQYDDLYQLTKVITPRRGTQEYRYDPVGNRVYYKPSPRVGEGAGEGVNYTYNSANELLTSGVQGFSPASYSYDGNGNLISKGDLTYTWDYRNQLTRVVTQNFSFAFIYDGDGRRVQKVLTHNTQLTTVNYLWDGMNVIAESDGNGNVTAEYLNGVGEVIGKIRYLPSGVKQAFYFLHDGLGSTTYLLDQFGLIVNVYYYDPFGKCWNVKHDPGHNTRFTGKEIEEDVGLYYFLARWLDPENGIFISRDPFEGLEDIPITLNPYLYCRNNPINFVDPFGRCPDIPRFPQWYTLSDVDKELKSINRVEWALFYSRPGGVWDFKLYDRGNREYENAGNFVLGYGGAHFDQRLEFLLLTSGTDQAWSYLQRLNFTSLSNLILSRDPNEKRDQEMIKKGYYYYKKKFGE